MIKDFDNRVTLHCQCFGDERVWSENYIKYALNHEKTITVYHDGHIAATLYLLPQKLGGFAKTMQTMFINCLCTEPKLRYQGFATQLLRRTFATQNVPLITLLPFNADFYKKQGFVALNLAETATVQGGLLSLRDADHSDKRLITECYDDFTHRHSFYAMRNKKYYRYMFDNELNGDCQFYIVTDGSIDIGYVVLRDDKISEYALRHSYDVSQINDLCGKNYIKLGSGSTYMMARLCNATRFIKAIRFNPSYSGKLSFDLYDELVDANGGQYTLYIDNGRLTRLIKNKNRECGVIISAEQLTSLGIGRRKDVDLPSTVTDAFLDGDTLLFDIF